MISSYVKYTIVCGGSQVAFVLSSSYIVWFEPTLTGGVQFCSAASSALSGEGASPELPATLLSPQKLPTFPFSWGKNRLNQQVLPCSPHLQWGCLFPLSVPIYNLPLTHHPRLTEKIIVCCGVCLLFVWFSEWKVKLFNLVKSWKTLPFLLHTHHSTATHKGLYKGERVGLGYLTRFLDTVSCLGLT